MSRQERRETVGIRQYIYCILACILTIMFVVWTGYWLVLLMLPIFVDIYITKFVPWGTWRKSKNSKIQVILEWVDAIVFALVGVWFLNSFFFQNYQIPSSSLEKSLLVGDFLCVSKVSYGGRSPMTLFSLPLTQHTIPVLNTKSYLEKPQLDYKRFSGTGQIERGDIVVFNYPSGDTVASNFQDKDYYNLCLEMGRELKIRATEEGKLNRWAKDFNQSCIDLGREYIHKDRATFGEILARPVDRRENYVKRCIGLPGEVIEVRNDSVFVNNKHFEGSDNEQHFYTVQTDGSMISDRVVDELGISNADKSYMYVLGDTDITDSIQAVACKLKYKDGVGRIIQYVNLTQAMKETLEKKPFVWSVVRQNEYINLKASLLGKVSTEVVYPSTYVRRIVSGSFPALWIPKAGETIKFDGDIDLKVAAYRRCIKNYEGNDFLYKDGVVYINGEKVDSYTFKLDYYFMMGDNRDNSADSRAWGFVPEDHIVGKPLFVWLSLDPDKGWFEGKIRWSRLFTKGNKK